MQSVFIIMSFSVIVKNNFIYNEENKCVIDKSLSTLIDGQCIDF